MAAGAKPDYLANQIVFNDHASHNYGATVANYLDSRPMKPWQTTASELRNGVNPALALDKKQKSTMTFFRYVHILGLVLPILQTTVLTFGNVLFGATGFTWSISKPNQTITTTLLHALGRATQSGTWQAGTVDSAAAQLEYSSTTNRRSTQHASTLRGTSAAHWSGQT